MATTATAEKERQLAFEGLDVGLYTVRVKGTTELTSDTSLAIGDVVILTVKAHVVGVHYDQPTENDPTRDLIRRHIVEVEGGAVR